MRETTTILYQSPNRFDYEAITLQQVLRRAVPRRRRLARKLAIQCPLFALERMQAEYPGYTYADWVADLQRKRGKPASFRRAKRVGFDWRLIASQMPTLLAKAYDCSKTRFLLRMEVPQRSGQPVRLVVEVRSVYDSEQGGQQLFPTSTLLGLLRGPVKSFLSHPAVRCWEEKNDFNANP